MKEQIIITTGIVLWLSAVYIACSYSNDPKVGDCYQVGRFQAKLTKPLKFGAYMDGFFEGQKLDNSYVPYFMAQRVDCYFGEKK